MSSVVLAARLLLAAVFAVAAVGKLLDLRASRASLVGFGVSKGLASVLGTALPFAELAVAIAIVPQGSARWAAVAALVLLLAFIAGIANALRRGEAPPCNCFGAIHSAPASRTTLARNVALAGAAVVAIGWGPGPMVDTWVSARSAAELVAVGLGIGALVLLALAVPTWVENRRLRHDLAVAEDRLRQIPHGQPVGSLAPDFSLPDGSGGRSTLSSLLTHGRPVMLVWTVAGCGPCEPMLPELRRLQTIAADRMTLVLVGISTVERYEQARTSHGGDLLLVDAVKKDPVLQAELDEVIEVSHAYDVHASPAAVLITVAGTIGSPLVDGRPAIEALLRLTLAGVGKPSGGVPTISGPAGAHPGQQERPPVTSGAR